MRDGEWVYGNLLAGTTDKGVDVAFIAPNLPIVAEAYDLWGATMYRVDPATVGQFTSLYDKNHNEIYEGDILAAQGIDEKLEVRFVRGVFAFLWNGDLDNEFPTGSPTHEWAEVVGNIHDNFELLKKGDKK